MDGRDDAPTRRSYLRGIVATALLPTIAGCSAQQTDSSNSTTETTTATTTDSSDRAPRIRSRQATPRDDGQVLAFHLEGRDEQGLRTAVVSYGDETERTDVEGKTVTLDGEFTDLQRASLSDGPGRVRFRLVNAAGEETTTTLVPDETAPELLDFSAEPTENAGEIALLLEGQDDVGLEHVAGLLGEETQFEESVSGKQEYSTEQVVSAPEDASFQQNTVTASLEDWNGNTTESEAETYVRKYDVMDDTRLDVGAVYIPWAGDKFGKCIDRAEPAIGRYDDPIAPETTSKHIDQMQGHGITNVLFNFNGTEGDRQSVERFVDSGLSDEIALRPFYTVKDYRWEPDNQAVDWKKDVLPNDMSFIRENILSRESAFTYDGRPVFNIWNAVALPWDEAYHDRIMEEWGSYAEFTADIREHLRVDGTDPFIIGGVTGDATDGFENSKPQIPRFLKELDGTTTWVAGSAWGEDNQATWEEVISYVEENFEGHRSFVEQHDMEFIPMVFPGFDDRMNACWGQDRLTPRSQNDFADLLEVADEYRTTDMIDIATWNDWTEGSQIEPGSFRGTDYGTAYLEVVEEFQQPD